MQKVLTTGALSDTVVALMAIDILIEIVFWHKIHQLGKNCLSEMHPRSKNRRSVNMISNITFSLSLYLTAYQSDIPKLANLNRTTMKP
jgi:hypothetical protein